MAEYFESNSKQRAIYNVEVNGRVLRYVEYYRGYIDSNWENQWEDGYIYLVKIDDWSDKNKFIRIQYQYHYGDKIVTKRYVKGKVIEYYEPVGTFLGAKTDEGKPARIWFNFESGNELARKELKKD